MPVRLRWIENGRSGVISPSLHLRHREILVNNIIWLVGAVVIVLFILGYFGLR